MAVPRSCPLKSHVKFKEVLRPLNALIPPSLGHSHHAKACAREAFYPAFFRTKEHTTNKAHFPAEAQIFLS